MKSSYTTYKIGELVKQSNNIVKVKPESKYTLLGLRLEGKGLFVREEKLGSEISSKALNRVIPGEFIYSRLFAWRGAFDFVTEEFNGYYVSNEFPTFTVDETKVDIQYLYYYFMQAKVWDEVEKYCLGVTKASRNRFKEKFFLDMEIDIPHISIQRSIVSKINSIKSKIKKVVELNEYQINDVKKLLYSKYSELVRNAEWKPLNEVAPIKRRKVDVLQNTIYYEIGIRSFGKGTFTKPSFLGSDLTWQQPYWLQKGDIVFSNIKAWEGAVAVIKDEDDGKVGSHRYISCVVDEDIAIPEFVLYYLLLPEGIEKLELASPGTADRNRTLKTKMLEEIQVPIPKVEKQKEFLDLKKKMDYFLTEQEDTMNELISLIPSLLDEMFKTS